MFWAAKHYIRGRILASLLATYLPILIFLGIATAIAVISILASVIVASQRPDVEKNSQDFDFSKFRFFVFFRIFIF